MLLISEQSLDDAALVLPQVAGFGSEMGCFGHDAGTTHALALTECMCV